MATKQPSKPTVEKPGAPAIGKATPAAPAAAGGTEKINAHTGNNGNSATPKKTSTKKVVIIVSILVFIFFVIPAILFTVAAVFVGNKVANDGVESTIEQAAPEGYDVNLNGAGVSINDGQGNEFSAGGQASVPEGFPSEVPLYSKTIVASGRTTQDGKTVWSVTVQTGDDVPTVANNLKNTFSQNGWVVEMESHNNDGGYITASNGTLQNSVFYSTTDGKTALVYAVSQL